MNVSYAPRALRDFEAIAGYLTERSPECARGDSIQYRSFGGISRNQSCSR